VDSETDGGAGGGDMEPVGPRSDRGEGESSPWSDIVNDEDIGGRKRKANGAQRARSCVRGPDKDEVVLLVSKPLGS
jgi:hypothetical protein